MGGRTSVKGVYLEQPQRRILVSVAIEKFGSLENFGLASSALSQKLKHGDYWIIKHAVKEYVIGRPVGVKSARAMFEALDSDSRVEFLKEIGSQRLVGEEERGYQMSPMEIDDLPRNISYGEFMRRKYPPLEPAI